MTKDRSTKKILIPYSEDEHLHTVGLVIENLNGIFEALENETGYFIQVGINPDADETKHIPYHRVFIEHNLDECPQHPQTKDW